MLPSGSKHLAVEAGGLFCFCPIFPFSEFSALLPSLETLFLLLLSFSQWKLSIRQNNFWVFPNTLGVFETNI